MQTGTIRYENMKKVQINIQASLPFQKANPAFWTVFRQDLIHAFLTEKKQNSQSISFYTHKKCQTHFQDICQNKI